MQIKQYLNSIVSYTNDKNTTHSSNPKDILTSAKTTTSKVLSKISIKKKISKQYLTFLRLIDFEIMTFIFLCRSYEVRQW